MTKQYRSFSEFYPFYLSQHQNPVCRLLHVAGVLGATSSLAVALTHQAWLAAALSPLIGYGCGWTGHFVFERNRPASFKQPIFSLVGDLIMTKDVLLGRIGLRSQEGSP